MARAYARAVRQLMFDAPYGPTPQSSSCSTAIVVVSEDDAVLSAACDLCSGSARRSPKDQQSADKHATGTSQRSNLGSPNDALETTMMIITTRERVAMEHSTLPNKGSRSNHFGVCPTCRRQNGCHSLGPVTWYVCDIHRVKWNIGTNLFSTWRNLPGTEVCQRGQARWVSRGRALHTSQTWHGFRDRSFSCRRCGSGTHRRSCRISASIFGHIETSWIRLTNCLMILDLDAPF